MTTNETDTECIVGRRRFVSALGATGITLTGVSTSAAASANNRRTSGEKSANGSGNKGNESGGDSRGKRQLADGSVDLLVYWSSGDAPNEFDYPSPSADPGSDSPGISDSDRGLFFAANDPKDGGLLDYTRFELTSNGETLHNDFELFQGAINASKPKPYTLTHEGDGIFESRGQVLNFEALPYEETPFSEQLDIDRERLPPIDILSGERWRAVGSDRTKLATDDDGDPLPSGQWGVTRVEVYSQGDGKPAYELSLLYLIWGARDPERRDPTPAELIEEIPEGADEAARELIEAGQLNRGGQSQG
jgi:hypothetical protein